MREDVIGRADVEDTPELEQFYRSLDKYHAGALWTVANTIEPWQPTSTSSAVLWKYEDLLPYVRRSAELVTPEKAGRRVVYLKNPGREAVAAAVGWLYSGLQIMLPGERASSHRHSAAALRFIMEGNGAYTIVDGHRMPLNARDLVLTPNGTWHEHGVDADGTACIWQDGLDIPFVNAMEANFYEVHPNIQQQVRFSDDDTSKTWGNPGIRPTLCGWTKRYSPLFKYEWETTYRGLIEYASASVGSHFDGTMVHYVNPVTGGHVMPTMGASMQRLQPGQHTKAHRHTGSFVYQVAQGSGYSIIEGKRLDWKQRDIFCLPSWSWHEHVNASVKEDACLFSFHDLPVIESLDLYREQAYEEAGGHQPCN